ncbi:DUF2167 domain-containing protein [Bernardetia sp. MNP-M8]|uniref:DUF2167 domain-containing protein n=1 Tax=Bernardetia sp. MNP-M8 TaxID=3127470 RepID=UPI0030D5F6F1
MKKIVFSFLALFMTFFSLTTYAQVVEDSTQILINNIEKSLDYQTGSIELETGNATLTVPEGFGYLNKEQANYVLSDLWGNPKDETILGLLVPSNKGVLADNSWVFVISFEEMGYVEDEDADDIDYDELLEQLKKETKDSNTERKSLGYETIDFVGWASKPYYDKNKKILHWAKEVKFGENLENTLNYNLRVLGRKGVFMLNAVASMKQLPEVKANIDNVIGSVEFKEGHKYADFIPDVDNVAAWTIGGLVAGKVLAKTGFFVVLLKFWKIIAVAIGGGATTLWKFLKGRKKEY